ncbi:acyl-CoA thioesterase-1 [Paraburkholderia fungorum]|uniref:Acyl-CoA thioesterase-1 n=1 Tax=Paraburkholderia fungorum TaxID=134537 RepID=A0A1H1JMR6_9BURK|nr:GDSL-type esterase/lipase family protein [Paraburkholderia fungorum]SDR51294.1 acyl-CoA thioesterase-1 [Paraburkholderia fungorum]
MKANRPLISFASICSAFLLVAVTPSVATAQSSPTPLKIVAFGASQTAGKGVAPDDAYPARLAVLLQNDGFDVTVENQGVSGDRLADEARRLETALPPTTRIVLYQPGTNDCGKRSHISQSDFREGIDAALSWMQAHHLLVLAMDGGCHFGVLEEESAKYGAMYYGKISAGLEDMKQADGQHLTPEGYQKLAEQVRPFVEKLIQEALKSNPQ